MVSKMIYRATRRVKKGNATYEVRAKFRLSDDCHNGHADFASTADVYQVYKNGNAEHLENFCGGCCHEWIELAFPEMKEFISLHLSNSKGQPMYAVANGFYFIKEGNLDAIMRLLRVSKEEAEYLFNHTEDKEHFKWLLVKMGLPQRWQDEANRCIETLEKLTNEEFKDISEKFEDFDFSPEEIYKFETLTTSGFYSLSNVQKRKKEQKEKEKQERIREVTESCNAKIKKAKEHLAVDVYILERFDTDNYIYYQHTNEVRFNWLDYKKKITQEEFIDFVNSLDYSKLPDGIKFYIGDK